MILFSDMDGVMVDMPRRVAGLFNVDYDLMRKSWKSGNPSMEAELKVSKSEFWRTINRCEPFWHTLDPYPYLNDLLNVFKGITVNILTSPATNPACAAGKMMWIQKYVPHLAPHMIICKDKFLLAKHGRILLDDTDKKIAAWDAVGEGYSITFPQPWNKNYMYADDPIGYVAEQLDIIKKDYSHKVVYA